jgi:XTP/dITP diphosphohydrolase
MALPVVLATRNPGKVVEVRRILSGLNIDLLDAAELALGEVAETGATFAENALLKARAGAAASGLACLADDSGLVVDVLGGAPGVHSARYAGRQGDDAANLALLLDRLHGAADRRARFVCVAALVTLDGREWTAEGLLEGTVTEAPRGSGGFGYDPVFQPLGQTLTTAELAPSDKDRISHRGRAFRAIRPKVAALAAESARTS